MASSDFEEVQRASDQLRIVRKQSEWYAGNRLSPDEDISQFSTQAPSRLAVDVHAMAASCALHAGDIASEDGRENIARQLYSEVLSYEDPAYSFYVGQARSRLAELEGRLEVKLHGYDEPLRGVSKACLHSPCGKVRESIFSGWMLRIVSWS